MLFKESQTGLKLNQEAQDLNQLFRLALIFKLSCQGLVGVIASLYIADYVLCFIDGNYFAVYHKSMIHWLRFCETFLISRWR